MPVLLEVVGIAAKDMSRSLAFYRTLGLPVPEVADTEDHVDLVTPGIRISWDTVELITTINGEWTEPVGHRIELAFRCDSRDDVDATYGRIVEAGYSGHRAPWDAFWGQRYAVVEDPDGNLISLFA